MLDNAIASHSRRTLVAVALAIALATTSIGFAQEPVAGLGVACGQVTATKGTVPFQLPGIPDATVMFEPGDYCATTDNDGSFSVKLPPGIYQTTISAEGYESTSQQVLVPVRGEATLSVFLFPEPKGAPVASLKLGGRGGQPGPVAYNTSMNLDASGSVNISRHGIRWEIRDENGDIVLDPYAVPAQPMQLDPSPIPGSSPLDFTFTPPKPGKFTVTLLLKNSLSEEESSASYVVEAINTPPSAIAKVIAGPNPPSKTPDGKFKIGSGLRSVVEGDMVYLVGWGLDKNTSSPETYNPGGNKPDVYGKNDDWLQRQFSFRWKLEYKDASGATTDMTKSLNGKDSQYPWFRAEKPGTYTATVTVCDNDPYGEPLEGSSSIRITSVAQKYAKLKDSSCMIGACHPDKAGDAPGMSCQSCHGIAQPHIKAKTEEEKRDTMDVSYDSNLCGRCHTEYHEWEKSRHADGYAFGHEEIAQPLMLNCAKCHYAEGFSDAMATAEEKGITFAEVEFKKPLYPGGPMFFDFDKLPPEKGTGISCQVCHDPHGISPENPEGLRASRAVLCGTCHAEKWQNVVMEGTAGVIGSAYEYPESDYSTFTPHNTDDKCVLCHMNSDMSLVDENGVASLGGHTMRMRDAGPDGKLGGFGHLPDDPSQLRQDYGNDDTLNLEPCKACHPDATTFNIDGKQQDIYDLWVELGTLLRERNDAILPGYKPGDKCASCHRGGTLPFADDPQLILENAYTNYKLVGNDRSWGIHNYQYMRQLLVDSIESVKTYVPSK